MHLMRANKPPAPHLGVLFLHKEVLEQRWLRPNIKKVAKNDKTTQDSKGVRSKLDLNDPIKVKAIHNKRVKGEPKTCTKEFLVHC